MKKSKVLCAIDPQVFTEDVSEEDLWYDLDNYLHPQRFQYIIPLIDHPHSDRENGQQEIHYHIDDRYMKTPVQGQGEGYYRVVPPGLYLRIPKDRFELREFELVQHADTVRTSTYPKFISKSKLKHKCIQKGKCPHRGYDLSKELPTLNESTMEWEIKCPLHGLLFDASSKELINEHIFVNN